MWFNSHRTCHIMHCTLVLIIVSIWWPHVTWSTNHVPLLLGCYVCWCQRYTSCLLTLLSWRHDSEFPTCPPILFPVYHLVMYLFAVCFMQLLCYFLNAQSINPWIKQYHTRDWVAPFSRLQLPFLLLLSRLLVPHTTWSSQSVLLMDIAPASHPGLTRPFTYTFSRLLMVPHTTTSVLLMDLAAPASHPGFTRPYTHTFSRLLTGPAHN